MNDQSRWHSPDWRGSFVRGGTIHFGGAHFQVPCIVKELAATRARLHVFAPHKLPETFRLRVELDREDLDCTILARGDKTVDVSVRRPSVRAQSAAAHSPHAGGAIAPMVHLWTAEDDEDDRRMLAEAFDDSACGCELTFFGDGAALIERLSGAVGASPDKQPALILLDLNMPRMDGRTALSHIRSNPGLKHIPVVVFTTSNSEADIMSTYTLGVSAYIAKPSRHEELVDVVRFLSSYWNGHIRLPRHAAALAS